MRATLLALSVALVAMPAIAQTPPPETQSVCAPALQGTVRVGQGARLPSTKIQLLVGAETRVDRQTMTDPYGRFRLPVRGRPRRGSQWLVRILGPANRVTDVTFTISPACGEPTIRVNAPSNSDQ